MKIFLNDNFQIENVLDKLENSIIKGSSDYDELIVYFPVEAKESYSSIYPTYSVRRADNREIGAYSTLNTADSSVTGYYGWKGYFNARDIAVEGALEITITFVINGTQKKNVAKVTTYVKDAVSIEDDDFTMDSLIAALSTVNTFLSALASKADLTNANQTITALKTITDLVDTDEIDVGTIKPKTQSGLMEFVSESSSFQTVFRMVHNWFDIYTKDSSNRKIEIEGNIGYLTITKSNPVANQVNTAVMDNTSYTLTLTNSSTTTTYVVNKDGITINGVRLATLDDIVGIINLTSSSGTLDSDQIYELTKATAVIHYNNRVYHKLAQTSSIMTFVSYDMLYSNDTTFNFARYLIQINLSTYAYTTSNRSMVGYTKSQIDTLLDAKINYTDVKDSLTNTSTDKPLSANQGKVLNEKILAIDNGSNIHSFAETESALALKVNTADIVDNLNDTSTTKPLSANQGKVLKGLIDAINTLLQSDDTTLDELQEIVSYIKNNKSLIDGITASKVNVSDIVNNLTTAVVNKPLSANMGVYIKSLIDNIVNGTTTVGNATNATYATNDANGNNIVNTYLNHEDAFASGMIQVGDYDESTGTILLTYESDVVSVDYNESTGIATFTY